MAVKSVAEGFKCSRCGRPDDQMTSPPIKGKLGEKVLAHSCNSCWQEWVLIGTKVVNELGLALSTPAGRDAYDQHLTQFLQLDAV
ncbi:MAG: Fe(2+)-trafficking protein [Phycisphaerales bacterium]|nr:MAG: Fe(2+)-trafficking protein [Phycisphaerales bacterium]